MPSSTKFMELTIGLILIFKATASNLITVLLNFVVQIFWNH